jgi:polyribonucleotide nucleotidyltransferase
MIKKIELDFHGRSLSIEVGRVAKQADGAALVRYGETVVLVTAVAAKDFKLDTDFFPLTVDYQEKTFAAGKIPGGFFKREGRPSEKEILTCRLIDRSIRPLFAEGLRCETQIIATVLYEILESLFAGHEAIQPLLEIQEELQRAVGKAKRHVPLAELDQAVVRRVGELASSKLTQALGVPEKLERYKRIAEVKSEVIPLALAEFSDKVKDIKGAFEGLKRKSFRTLVVEKERRIDGRGLKDIRPITCEVEILPRTHGSALFTRGETQALVVTTLGTASDEQRVDALIGEHFKKFMLHYNFPPFSVGEVKFLRGPGRREIGHGNLAERALLPVLPPEESFPYTVRIVSEILESNGSTSMATVCGGSLSLMDAGVPVSAPVAGIAMGLIKEGEHVRVLSDILGDEDHLGDMDFKVAGTPDGVTSLQMDIKISGVDRDIMRQALYQAKEGRLHILGVMGETLSSPRTNVSGHAPRIITIRVKPDKIREIIGPGGKVIRGIIEATGVKMDVEDDGTVTIASSDEAASRKAIEMVQRIAAEAEVGKIYKGTVRKIVDFGAFVEILPGTDGLIHISQLAPERVRRVADVLKEGDEVMVKVLEVDRQGKIRLSRKEALLETGSAGTNAGGGPDGAPQE